MQFDWLPKELITKCNFSVAKYHKTYGGSIPKLLWQRETMVIVGAHKDLLTLLGSAHAAWKISKAIIVAATLVLTLAAILNWWLAFAVVPLILAAIYFERSQTECYTMIVAILLAFEVLVDDFAGWGTRFPKARQEAGALVAGQTRLIDIYLKNRAKLDPKLVGQFRPSDKSGQVSKQDQKDEPISRSTDGFDDSSKTKFVEAISTMLADQIVLVRGSIKNSRGRINRKAVGYIYGFIDCALQTIGQDMRDLSISVPITYQVIRRLFPGEEEVCMSLLSNNLGDREVLTGMMEGGQQYADFARPEKQGWPMGLAKILLEDPDENGA